MSKLYEHNQVMFENVKDAMQTSHKICIVQATGTGKSFLFMEIMKSLFPDKKALYVVPKHSVSENIRQYNDFSDIADNVIFTTYTQFNYMIYKPTDFDVIFIDECHHLNSPVLGYKCNEFVDAAISENNTYVFGLTATPIINKKNIVDKYFDIVLNGLSLKDAIETGLFPKLNYHPAIPDINMIPDNLREKYTVQSSEVMLNKLLEKYKLNRWLVYFTNVEELNEGYENLKKIFPDYDIYKMHSREENCNEYISKFNEHKGKVVLCSVSMLLEGVHLKDIEGVILFRHVTAEHTLTQIIGRLFSIGMKITPVFIDVTSSFKLFRRKRRVSSRGNSGREAGSIRDVIEVSCKKYGVIDFLTELAEYYEGLTPIVSYKGYTAYSLYELASLLGVNTSCVYNLRDIGESPEEIIDYCLADHYVIDYRGYKCKTAVELCKQLNLPKTEYARYKQTRGYTLKQFIDYILDVKPFENKKLTNCEAAELAGVSTSILIKIKKEQGFSNNEDAVDYINKNYDRRRQAKYRKNNDMPVLEYRGITVYNHKDIAQYFNYRDSWVSKLLKKHPDWTLKDVIDYGYKLKAAKVTVNHRGITGSTYSEISFKLGKNEDYVGKKLREHPELTIEDIIDDVLNNKYIVNYRGYNAVSKVDLAKQLGIKEGKIYSLLRYGTCKSYEEVIDYVLDGKVPVIAYVDGEPYYNMHTLAGKLRVKVKVVTDYIRGNKFDKPPTLTRSMFPNQNSSKYIINYRGIQALDRTSLRKALNITDDLFRKLCREEDDVEGVIDRVFEMYPENYKY